MFILISLAICWDLLLGEPPTMIHPTVWMGQYIHLFWKLNKVHRPLFDFIWGFLLVLIGLILFVSPIILFTSLTKDYPFFLFILSIPLLKVSFSIQYLLKSGLEIKAYLKQGNIEKARKYTGYHFVSRNVEKLNQEEIIACVVESISENITDAFTSPLFFSILFGLPGAWGYRFINTCDAMIGYHNKEFEWGGKIAAKIDSFVNMIPARLSAYLIVLASFMVDKKSAYSSFNGLKFNKKRTKSPNAGWTMGAMAGALQINLEKKGEYCLQGGNKPITIDHIDQCLKITKITLFLICLNLFLVEGLIIICKTMVA